jgi:hypothetical protein
MTDPRPRLVRAALLLRAVGATLGSALDAIHSHFGAVIYLTAAVGLGGLARWFAAPPAVAPPASVAEAPHSNRR